MRIEVHHFHHHVPPPGEEPGDLRVLASVASLHEFVGLQFKALNQGLETMSDRLNAAIAALTAKDADLKTDLDMLLAQDSDTKAQIAKAVAAALADAGVADDKAAAAIETVNTALDAHTAAITAVLTPAAPGGGDQGGGDTGAALALGSSILASGQVGVDYAATLVASGGQAPYSFVSDPDSQNGLLVSADGVLAGTPKNVETDTFTVTVTDAAGATASGSVSLEVVAADNASG